MVWTVRPSRWSESVDGPYLGAERSSASLDFGELWLLDLPATGQNEDGHRYRGILLSRFTIDASAEDIEKANALAVALNDAEAIATVTNGRVDYARLVPSDGDLVEKLLEGTNLAAAWTPSDGERDLLKHWRQATRHPTKDSDFSDISFGE